MSNEKANIWIGDKDLTRDPEFIEIASQEFQSNTIVDHLSKEDSLSGMESNRRDFLKMLGFGLGAATIAAGCEIPVKRAIPYVIKPDAIVPGVANYYASSYVKGGDYCPILVKTREGRPIKVEGNNLSGITGGGTSARAQAMVLELYDQNRYTGPKNMLGDNPHEMSWDELDAKVKEKLAAAKGIRVVTNTMLSPTDKKALDELVAKYPNTQVVVYDSVSSSAILDANESSFGLRMIPDYHFDKAEVIVSFNADFLGSWISPVEYAHKYIQNRVIEKVDGAKMSRHIQVESHMSLTGSNADNRILVKPSHQGLAIAALYNEVIGAGINTNDLNEKAKSAIKKVADELKSANGKSIIVSGSNNIAEQILVNAINNALGNYDQTIDFNSASLQRQGNEGDLEQMITDINSGAVDMVIFNQCNPVYDFSMGTDLASALSKVDTKVAMAYLSDETAAGCDYIAPVNHVLESWGDVEAKKGQYSFIQPTIAPLFDTRQSGISFLTWSESENLDSESADPYLEYLRKNWEETLFPQQTNFLGFQAFWDSVLHDGLYNVETSPVEVSFNADISSISKNISKPLSSDLEISFFETANIGNGQFANNPWLMEMPDPVARTSWGNYLSVPVEFDGKNKMVGFNDLEDGDIVEVNVGDNSYTVPVVKQFGQMPGTVGLALGYGRSNSGTCANGVGVNVNPSTSLENGKTKYYAGDVTVSGKLSEEQHFSCVQYHHTIGVTTKDEEGNVYNADEAALISADLIVKKGFQGALTDRSILFNSSLSELKESVDHMQEKRHEFQHLNEQTLYPYDEYNKTFYSQGHHWGMHVDMNACIGCGACTVACMAENNVPVVGKKEVSRHHEMSWLRIDRYYYGDVTNPNVAYQPMMCQHCDNAPCENVCPVNATNHSSEGLNQMTYNRCVGTRYCANNCPFKVRRFNWLDYTSADLFPANQRSLNGEAPTYYADNLTRMVLNPDVTVRVRGVIEKCSFCVQRIQEGKLTAKKESRRLRDADVRSACQTACPTGAITFGDKNNKDGELSKKLSSELNFVSLEETNVRSSVNYTIKVNNRDKSMDA